MPAWRERNFMAMIRKNLTLACHVGKVGKLWKRTAPQDLFYTKVNKDLHNENSADRRTYTMKESLANKKQKIDKKTTLT
jgi:hypothetical protein